MAHSATSPNACHWGVRAVVPKAEKFLKGLLLFPHFVRDYSGNTERSECAVSTLTRSTVSGSVLNIIEGLKYTPKRLQYIEYKPRCLPSGYTNVLTNYKKKYNNLLEVCNIIRHFLFLKGANTICVVAIIKILRRLVPKKQLRVVGSTEIVPKSPKISVLPII